MTRTHPQRRLHASKLCCTGLALAAIGATCPPAQAQSAAPFQIQTRDIGKRVDSMLGLMAFSVVPELTTSSLSISAGTGSQQDTGLLMTQFAGGFTVSQSTPLYLEGGIAYSRYDPTFVASNGTDTREVPVKWNSITLNGGIGWDFPIAEHLKLRPIFNFSLGSMTSDIVVGASYLAYKVGADFEFLNKGRVDVYGLGGSLMLDYEYYTPEYEIDVEYRISDVYLRTFQNSGAGIDSNADAASTSLWARWRAPTGWTALDRPVRYVLEGAHSSFLGSQAGLLGFDRLSSVGAGLELDSSKYNVLVTRTRLLMRYCFGENVSGTSISIAMSF